MESVKWHTPKGGGGRDWDCSSSGRARQGLRLLSLGEGAAGTKKYRQEHGLLVQDNKLFVYKMKFSGNDVAELKVYKELVTYKVELLNSWSRVSFTVLPVLNLRVPNFFYKRVLVLPVFFKRELYWGKGWLSGSKCNCDPECLSELFYNRVFFCFCFVFFLFYNRVTSCQKRSCC